MFNKKVSEILVTKISCVNNKGPCVFLWAYPNERYTPVFTKIYDGYVFIHALIEIYEFENIPIMILLEMLLQSDIVV